ncbi:hypothetical protein GCM10010343_75890 [Streptomyces avidinii]|nr:hypothetical protein GCM10010343_75890 [Streptomyces avidinii]
MGWSPGIPMEKVAAGLGTSEAAARRYVQSDLTSGYVRRSEVGRVLAALVTASVALPGQEKHRVGQAACFSVWMLGDRCRCGRRRTRPRAYGKGRRSFPRLRALRQRQ